MNEIINNINTVGFPVFACIILASFLYKRDVEDREDRRKAAQENSKERREFLKTNQQLSENLKFFQVDVKNDISELKHEQEVSSNKLDITDKKIDRLIGILDNMEGMEEDVR